MEIDFKALREAHGWTLEKAAEISLYRRATINALEVEGRGSDRLKQRLLEVYGAPAVTRDKFHASDVGSPPSSRIDIAKLRTQVLRLKRQLEEIEATLNGPPVS